MSTVSQRGSVDRPALSRLISVPADTFATDHWGSSPLLSRSAGGFDDLFSADAVDELVSERGIRTPFVRMAKEGVVLPASNYTASGGYGAEIGDQLDSAKVLAEFTAGSTIVLQGLHRTWAPLRTFTRQLVHDLGHPAQVNAYVTPASSRGFDPHYDVHDVFVVQIAGEKRWMIHEPVHVDPLAGRSWTDHRAAVADRATGTPAIDETFRPGDVLYLPRGWIHSATALGGTSIHLTIGVAALTRFDALEQLIDGLADDPAMRSSLPLGAGTADDLATAITAVLTDAAARLAADSAALVPPVVERLQQRVRRSTRPEPLRPVATAAEIGSFGVDTMVQWRGGLPVRVSAASGSVSIALETTTITLPELAADTVSALSDGAVLRVGDLPGLDTDSAMVVARRLVREGVLVVRS